MRKYIRYWLPTLIYCVLIFILSSFSKPFPKSLVLLNDKLLHIVEYSILGFLLARSIFSLDLRYSKRLLFVSAVILSTLYGISDEVHQSLVPGRNVSFGDMISDGFGSLIGAFGYFKMLLK